MIDTITQLAMVDPATVSILASTDTSAVEYLAQRTGNSGISTVDRLVNTLIRIIGAVIGLGFFFTAMKDGWGKGDAKQQGLQVVTKILIGVGIIVLFTFIPNLISEGTGLFGSFL